MVSKSAFRPALMAVWAVLIAWTAAPGFTADKVDAKAADAKLKTVELFAAMEAGDVHVKLIPRDSRQSNVLIENKLDVPLRVKLPDAFAGVPVLAQMAGGIGMGGLGGGMGGLGGGMGGMGGFGGGMGGGQGFGGGMGGFGGGMGGMGGFGGGMMGGMGGMGGFFNLKPGQVGKLRLPTVCLEHGKPEPNPRMAYQLVPIEKLTTKPEVIEVCKMLGTGKLPQSAAQAAAWHFTDNLTWDQLRMKVGVDHLIGPDEPYFSLADLQLGMRIASEAMQRARTNPAYQEKSDSLSGQ